MPQFDLIHRSPEYILRYNSKFENLKNFSNLPTVTSLLNQHILQLLVTYNALIFEVGSLLRMIYSLSQFSAMMMIMLRVIKRRKVAKSSAKPRRSPPSVPRLKAIDYWYSPWGQLLRRFAAIDGGPSIASRDGKLFRRRFRVPYGVYRNLVQKCHEKNLFCDSSSRSICPVEIKLLSVLQCVRFNQSSCRSNHTSRSFLRHSVAVQCGHVALFDDSVL